MTRPPLLARTASTLNRVRARGPREVLQLGISRLRGWMSSSDELLMFVRDTARAGDDRADLRFREAVPGDGESYARWIGTDSATTFRSRLSDGTKCFVVEDGEAIVHSSWVTTTAAWTRELHAFLTPPAGSAYIYESFTRSEARGRGIYPYALHRIVDWGAGAGLQRLWVAVEADNPASLRAVSKAGFGEAFRLPFARRFGRVRLGDPSGPLAEEARAFLSRTRP